VSSNVSEVNSVGNCLKSFNDVYEVFGKKSSETIGKLKKVTGREVILSFLNLY
jgi:hypothetical protein